MGVAAVLFLVVVSVPCCYPSGRPGPCTPPTTRSSAMTSSTSTAWPYLVVGITLFVSMLGGVYIAQEEKE